MYYPKFILEPECTVCQMELGFFTCVGDNEELIVMCSECDSIWLDPNLEDGPYASKAPDWKCPKSNSSLGDWATKEQIIAAGLWEFIINPDDK